MFLHLAINDKILPIEFNMHIKKCESIISAKIIDCTSQSIADAYFIAILPSDL